MEIQSVVEKFWAKTGARKRENGLPEYHPVIFHLADTAAVAMEIIKHHLSAISDRHIGNRARFAGRRAN